MNKFLVENKSLVVACAFLATAALAKAEDRPAEKILADIRAVEMPKVPQDRTDQKAVQAYITKSQKAMEQKAALIGELYKAAPANPELVKLLPQRWSARMTPDKVAAETKAEIDDLIANSKDEKLVGEAAFFKVVMAFRKAGQKPDTDALTQVADEFIKKFPKDDRGAMILSAVANMTTDEAKKEAIYKRLEKDYPDSPAVRSLAGERRLRDAVGKPFEISFVEAIKGSQISSQTLKGKVVVVDFWATWCGPCVAEMPNMKELYAKYKDQGVEFVGVSLDSPKAEGGYDKLKEFVEKNKIEWPQYYQGNGWESEFSASWGINSIPRVFLVDADGNLASTQARGKLDELIPEYLEKAKKGKTEVKTEVKP